MVYVAQVLFFGCVAAFVVMVAIDVIHDNRKRPARCRCGHPYPPPSRFCPRCGARRGDERLPGLSKGF